MTACRLDKIKIIISILIFMSAPVSGVTVKGVQPGNKERKIILIDPGHGGIDGGALSKWGTIEKKINLSVSLKLRDKLKEMGYEVIMTRETDIGLYSKGKEIAQMKAEDLSKRCKMKKDSKCNLFISVHQNFFFLENYSGAQVWYSKNAESEKIAHILQENFKADLDRGNNRVEKPAMDAYKVLRCHTDIPSVIVECGFLTNYNEERKLRDDTYQDRVAQSIAKSVKEYFDAEGSGN